MGWRKTGQFHKPREIVVHTCDQCSKDIGTPDGFGSKHPYFEITVKHSQGSSEESGMTTYSLCSLPCLKSMAVRLASGERVPDSDL